MRHGANIRRICGGEVGVCPISGSELLGGASNFHSPQGSNAHENDAIIHGWGGLPTTGMPRSTIMESQGAMTPAQWYGWVSHVADSASSPYNVRTPPNMRMAGMAVCSKAGEHCARGDASSD